MIQFELPYPPSLNSYYRHVGSRTLISAKGRKYRLDVVELKLRQRLQAAPPGKLCVELDLYPPDLRRRDVDNTPKCLLDAITNAGLWADDSLIDRLTVTRREVVKGGKVVVTITAWEGDRCEPMS